MGEEKSWGHLSKREEAPPGRGGTFCFPSCYKGRNVVSLQMDLNSHSDHHIGIQCSRLDNREEMERWALIFIFKQKIVLLLLVLWDGGQKVFCSGVIILTDF